MSLSEILQASAKLKPRERASLRAYLFMLDRINDPAWKKEMTRRRRHMARGKHVAGSTVLRRLAARNRKAE
jgi:hypothetical protein